MTIFELGALGEFVGAIGVVVTLVYLAIQVKQSKVALEANTASLDENRRLTAAHAYQARAMIASDQSLQHAMSNNIQRIKTVQYQRTDSAFEKAYEALSEEDRGRYQDYVTSFLQRLDSVHYQYQNGVVAQFETRRFK